jgi:hypothetical protein
MNPAIEYLFVEQEAALKRLKHIRAGIESLQFLCLHEWEPNGHDSHHNWEKCKLCGKEQSQ